MAKFIFIEDCIAEGTNITPYGSDIPNFLLTYFFPKGEIVESLDQQDVSIEVETSSGTFKDGAPFTGPCVFTVPRSKVELVVEEGISLPPAPPELPLVETHVVDSDVPTIAMDQPKSYTESTGSTINIDYQTSDYQPIEKEKEDGANDLGLKLGQFLILLFIGIIIWMFLANC